MLRKAVSGLVYLCLSTNVWAAQTHFDKQESASSITLSYGWRDHFDAPQSIEFNLNKVSIQQQYVSTKNYRQEIAQRYVYTELLRQVQKVDPREARIRLQRLGSDIRVSVSSQSQDMLRKWQSTMAEKQIEAFDAYLDDNYYIRFKTHLGKEGVKHDHIHYLRDSIEILLPVAQSIYAKLEEGSEARDYVNLLLGWVQSIPYNTLDNRLVSNGTGYSSPLEVLLNNQGDCDSKTVLIAALMRSLLPQLSMQMVFLPGHALLAVNLPRREHEREIEIDGMRFMLLEPTGPAMMRVGLISERSEQGISGRQFVTEKVP